MRAAGGKRGRVVNLESLAADPLQRMRRRVVRACRPGVSSRRVVRACRTSVSYGRVVRACRGPGIPESRNPRARLLATRYPQTLAGEDGIACQRVQLDDLLDDQAGIRVWIRALSDRPQALARADYDLGDVRPA